MAQPRKRRKIVRYAHSTYGRGGTYEILECGHMGHYRTPLAILIRIKEGKSRLCEQCRAASDTAQSNPNMAPD